MEQKHLTYLDELRESGETNMLHAKSYLMYDFPELTKNEAGDIFKYWRDNFDIEGTKI